MTLLEGVAVISVEPSPTPSTETVIFTHVYDNNWLDMPKTCSKCGLEKPLSEFGTASATKKDGYNSWCKQCVRDSTAKFRVSPSGIYSGLKGRQRFYRKHRPTRAKPFTLKRKEFIEWYETQPKQCHYCGISEDDITKIDDSSLQKTGRLTVDCKDNDIGYTLNNIVLACGRCNFNKGDFFTYDEWMHIAQNYIKPRWKKMLETSTKTGENKDA